MSQTRITGRAAYGRHGFGEGSEASLHPELMMELQADAEQFQSLVKRIGLLAHQALRNAEDGKRDETIRNLHDVLEGMVLLKKLAGV